MNDVFKNLKIIQLDDNFYLEPDQFKGIVLNHKTFKTVLDKVSQTEKQVPKIKSYYYPRLSQVLTKYLQLSQMESTSIGQLLETTRRVEAAIDSLTKKN